MRTAPGSRELFRPSNGDCANPSEHAMKSFPQIRRATLGSTPNFDMVRHLAEDSRLQGSNTDFCAPGFRASEHATSHAPSMAREAAGTSTINFAKAERRMRRKTRKSMNFDALWHKMRQLRQNRDAENARFDELLHAVPQMTRYKGAPDFRGAEVDLRRRRSRRKRGGARVRRAKRLRAAHQETTGVEPQGEASPCSECHQVCVRVR